MTEISIAGISLLALIGVIIALLKQLGIPARLLPLLSMIIGVAFGLLTYYFGQTTWLIAIVGGIMTGAAVSGFYDFGKKTLLGK